MYKLYKNDEGQVVSVQLFQNNTCLGIPFAPANTDAKEFAKWLQEGNRPEPAEDGGVVTDEWIAETIAKLLPANE